MKKIVIAVLLTVIAGPAFAAGSGKSAGVNLGLDMNGVIGLQGEFDVSSQFEKAPVSAQFFYKGYSQSYASFQGTYRYSYNGFGVAAIYDFSSQLHLDKKIKPYAGLGLYTMSASFNGPAGTFANSGASGGLYITAGARYTLMPEWAADLNYNNIGGLTIGVNYNFK